jgi:hypothetical protein
MAAIDVAAIDVVAIGDRLLAAYDTATALAPITPGEIWSAAYGSLGVPGLTVTFA